MKIGDLFWLGLENIRVRKLRTVLNLVGIVLSSVLVICTLSATNGIAIALEKFVSQSDAALRFEVFPDFDRSVQPPEEVLAISEDVPERRRKRIQERLKSDWQKKNLPRRYLIPTATLDDLNRSGTVVDVLPNIRMQCEMAVDEKNRPVVVEGGSLFDKGVENRIVAGDFLNEKNINGVLIHEFLAFELGYASDADLKRLIGQRIDLRFRESRKEFSILDDDFFRLSFSDQAKILSVMDQVLAGTNLSSIDRDSLALAREYAANRRKKLVDENNKTTSTAVPSTIKLRQVKEQKFTIVGVFRNRDQEDPRTLLNRFFGGRANLIVHYSILESIDGPNAKSGFKSASVFVQNIANLQSVIEEAESKDLRTVSAADYIQRIHRGLERAKYTVGGVVLLIMVVSAIGIANTMFIALFERTEEIGIMKAVGASNANVMWMIVFECIVTGLLAGVISLLIASVVAMIGNGYLLDYFESRSKIKLDGQVFVINLSISAIAFFLAVMVTTVAGIWPAWRAARLDPVVAMGRT